jgi:O-antigen ligase
MIVPGPDNTCFRVARGVTYGWIAFLVLALYPYTEDPAEPIKLLGSAVAAVALSLIWAAGVVPGKAPWRRMGPVFYVLLLFLAVQGIAAARSELPIRAFAALRPWYVFTLIAFVVYQVFPEPRHLRNLFRAIVCCVGLSSAYGLAQYIGIDPFPWSDRTVEEYRGLPATYGNPNFAGHALVISIVLCIGLLVDAWPRGRRRRDPILCALAFGLLLAHLYLSGMRGGVVALGFAGLFASVHGIASWRGVRPLRAGLIATLATIILLGSAVVTALMIAPQLNLDSSILLRINGYAGAAALFRDHWLWGVGPGGYAVHNSAYWTDFEALWYALEGKRNLHVHNEWLEVAVESGLPGLAAFIALFLFAVTLPFAHPVYAVARHRALLLTVPTALAAAAVDACTGFNLHVPVSGALILILLVQQPSITEGTILKGRIRATPLALVALALLLGLGNWRQFESALLFQHAQGALAWADRQERAGATDQVAQARAVAASSLADARMRTPWNAAIWIRQGDLMLAEGRYDEARDSYGFASLFGGDLPGISVQRARNALRSLHYTRATPDVVLEVAERHAREAVDLAPSMAEAWAMVGWVAFERVRVENNRGAALTGAISAFEKARALGMAKDTDVLVALSQAYGMEENWPASAATAEDCVQIDPSRMDAWAEYGAAAANAGLNWPLRYRQALLYQLGQFASGRLVLNTRDATALASRLVALESSPLDTPVLRKATEALLDSHPEDLAFWGAWLACTGQIERTAMLVAREEALGNGAPVPEGITALAGALKAPSADALERASEALWQALATAPGGERPPESGTAYGALLDVLQGAARDSGYGPALLGGLWTHLGAARFEAGDLHGASALLHGAEGTTAPADRAKQDYYRSRLALRQGQTGPAMALARAAMDHADPIEYRWQRPFYTSPC